MKSRLHHIALGAHDVERMAAFYSAAFDLTELRRHLDGQGELRSIWLDLGGGAILMVERTHEEPRRVEGVGAGPFLLAFAVRPEERGPLEERLAGLGAPVEARTEFTSYARDPEGNRVALSHFPEAKTPQTSG